MVGRKVEEEKWRWRELPGREGTMQFGGKQLFWVKQRFSPTLLSNQSKGRGPEAWWKEAAPVTQEEKPTSETGAEAASQVCQGPSECTAPFKRALQKRHLA